MRAPFTCRPRARIKGEGEKQEGYHGRRGSASSATRPTLARDNVHAMKILLPLLVALAAPGGRPQVGDAAPDFKLSGSDGQTVSLAAYKGKKTVVLAFFPKAFTGG